MHFFLPFHCGNGGLLDGCASVGLWCDVAVPSVYHTKQFIPDTLISRKWSYHIGSRKIGEACNLWVDVGTMAYFSWTVCNGSSTTLRFCAMAPNP